MPNCECGCGNEASPVSNYYLDHWNVTRNQEPGKKDVLDELLTDYWPNVEAFNKGNRHGKVI